MVTAVEDRMATVSGKHFPFSLIELLWLGHIINWPERVNSVLRLNALLNGRGNGKKFLTIGQLYDFSGEDLVLGKGFNPKEVSICARVMKKLSLPFSQAKIIPDDGWTDKDEQKLKIRLHELSSLIDQVRNESKTDIDWAWNLLRRLESESSGNGHGQLVISRPNVPSELEVVGFVVNLPIDRVIPNPDQPRKYFDEATIIALAASIGEEGQKVPIKVVEMSGISPPKWIIEDGERRWRAIRRLGVKFIRATVEEPKSDNKLHEDSFVTNFGSEGHTAIEAALAIKKLQVEDGLTQKQIALRIAKSELWVSKYGSLNNLHPELWVLLDPTRTPKGKLLPATIGFALARLKQESQLPLFSEARKSGRVTMEQVKRLVEKKIGEGQALTTRNAARGPRKRKPVEVCNLMVNRIEGLTDNAHSWAKLSVDTLRRIFHGRSEALPGNLRENIKLLVRDLEILSENLRALSFGE